jgi:hypothetical protein
LDIFKIVSLSSVSSTPRFKLIELSLSLKIPLAVVKLSEKDIFELDALSSTCPTNISELVELNSDPCNKIFYCKCPHAIYFAITVFYLVEQWYFKYCMRTLAIFFERVWLNLVLKIPLAIVELSSRHIFKVGSLSSSSPTNISELVELNLVLKTPLAIVELSSRHIFKVVALSSTSSTNTYELVELSLVFKIPLAIVELSARHIFKGVSLSSTSPTNISELVKFSIKNTTGYC